MLWLGGLFVTIIIIFFHGDTVKIGLVIEFRHLQNTVLSLLRCAVPHFVALLRVHLNISRTVEIDSLTEVLPNVPRTLPKSERETREYNISEVSKIEKGGGGLDRLEPEPKTRPLCGIGIKSF